ncbi:MAG: aminotransferase class I/II-fold pyridoxal phosphate-dependent enzyme [Vicinamibacteria bacterium]
MSSHPFTARSISGSKKAESFSESVIREMTRLCQSHGGINLAQGFPDFPAPKEIKEAAVAAIRADVNQYAITWGAKSFRDAIAENYSRFYGMDVDPEKELVVCCGSTEAMMSAMLGVVDPGDEVVVFEPFYENYGPDAILSGAVPRYVTLHEPDWRLDPDELAAAFNDRTRAIIINTPNNPTGKVFTREELTQIAALCQKWGVVAITDEIYEHILYEGEHIPIASLDGMRERTVTINSLSKTYSLTGWRVGWALAPPVLSDAIRKVHDFLTVGAAAPLQEAGVVALGFSDEYYRQLSVDYRARRDVLLPALEEAGFSCYKPNGAYYVMTDISRFGFPDDVSFSRHLVEKIGVAAVPGSSFYHRPEDGAEKVRFTFCKREETLRAAADKLAALKPS